MIGKFLKALRAASGKKTGEFAQVVGCSASFYSLVEHGHRPVSRRALAIWAKNLGISPGALDLLALEAPHELTKKEIESFDNVRAALLGTLIFKFMDAKSGRGAKEIG